MGKEPSENLRLERKPWEVVLAAFKTQCLGCCALSESGQIQMNVNEIFGYSLPQGR